MNYKKFLDIDEFISKSAFNSSKGVARAHRFFIRMNLNGTINSLGNDLDNIFDYLQWSIYDVSLPGVNMNVNFTTVAQHPRHYAVDRQDQDLQISFIESSDMVIKRFFERWIKLQWNPITGQRNLPTTYLGEELDVVTLTPLGEVGCVDRFRDFFPFSITDYDLGVDKYDHILTKVNFKFRSHVVGDINEVTIPPELI